jgi:hypothetical protein
MSAEQDAHGPVIVRAVCTCPAFPSQWDAWDDQGRYWYLRYRSGTGTAETQPNPDISTWVLKTPEIVFAHGHPRDGEISLEEFAILTGITLALNAAAPDA